MKTLRSIVVGLVWLVAATAGAKDNVKKAAAPPAANPADTAFAEMKAAFGAVPTFMKQLPPEVVPALWSEFRDFEASPTVVPSKYKDLMSIAVAAQIPCKYCVYADTEFAKMDGATDREIQEAVLMASITRLWSTILNGSGQDEAAFKKEADAAFAFVKKGGKPGAQPIAVTDAASAQQDIAQTFGTVPSFFKHVSPQALPGYWSEMKAIQLNPETKIPGKYKELIGLAVAAQIPCKYCVYFHTEAAKMNGASQVEIDEALTMAASTRHWSTWLNGMQLDEKVFKKEVDGMLKAVKKAQAKPAP